MLTSAEVIYVADEGHITLYLGNRETAFSQHFFLEAGAFSELRRTLLGIECELCGGNHPDVFHGSPIIQLDTQRSPVAEELGSQLRELVHLFDNEQERQYHDMLEPIYKEWQQESFKPEHRQDWDFDYFDNKMAEVCAMAGYFIVNNSDGAAWLVYTAISDEDPS